MNTIIDSPCFIPLLDTKNSPTINGIINSKTKPSNLNWYEKEVKPIQNSFALNSSSVSWVAEKPPTDTKPPAKIIPPVIPAVIIFCFLGILLLRIKYMDIGKNAAVNAFEEIDKRYETGDKGQNL